MKKILLAFTILLTVEVSAQYKYPFQNPDLPYQERVENLISLLTPVEKVGLMMNKDTSGEGGTDDEQVCISRSPRNSILQLVERGLSWRPSGGVYRLSATHRYGGCV